MIGTDRSYPLLQEQALASVVPQSASSALGREGAGTAPAAPAPFGYKKRATWEGPVVWAGGLSETVCRWATG